MKLKRHTSQYRAGGDDGCDDSDACRRRSGSWQRQKHPGHMADGRHAAQLSNGCPFTPLAGQFTFHEGGTMAEYGIGPGSSPALRSPGHGVWQRRHGWQVYSFAFTLLSLRRERRPTRIAENQGRPGPRQGRRYIRHAIGHRGSRSQRRRDRRRLRNRRRDAIRIAERGAGLVLWGSPVPARLLAKVRLLRSRDRCGGTCNGLLGSRLKQAEGLSLVKASTRDRARQECGLECKTRRRDNV